MRTPGCGLWYNSIIVSKFIHPLTDGGGVYLFIHLVMSEMAAVECVQCVMWLFETANKIPVCILISH
jgi:hypothetical protein